MRSMKNLKCHGEGYSRSTEHKAQSLLYDELTAPDIFLKHINRKSSAVAYNLD